MVYSLCIHSAWDLGAFCRQQHSWHPVGSSRGLKPRVICREGWRDLWVSHAVQGGWLAESELLFGGIYLTGDHAARTPVVLENGSGELQRWQKTLNLLYSVLRATGCHQWKLQLLSTFYCLTIICTEEEKRLMFLVGKWLLQHLLIERRIMLNWEHYYSWKDILESFKEGWKKTSGFNTN